MRLGHVVFVVRDLAAMEAFYVGTLGLQVTDRGRARGRDAGPSMLFLSFDRRAVHHQLALLGPVDPLPPAGRVHHAAFEVDDLSALRACWQRLAGDDRVGGLDGARPTAVFQGDQWSIRFRDPEGNGLEVYAPTPWDVRQPFFRPMDPTLDDAALTRWAEQVLAGHDHWPRGTRPPEPVR
jgi:catechol 2,3-dioxygenase-like lactoylglutathione lyase family enzyme